MGELERTVRRQIRLAKVQKAVLYTIAAVGVLSSATAGTKILRALIKEFKWRRTRRNPSYTINESVKRLCGAGLIHFDKTDHGTFLRLTKAGKLKLHTSLNANLNEKPKRWDKKWRIIIFDIAEKKRGLRAKLRRTLTVLGFARLQNSVWVYPYNCEDLIIMIKADLKIGRDVLYIIADRVENDRHLREKFSLGA